MESLKVHSMVEYFCDVLLWYVILNLDSLDSEDCSVVGWLVVWGGTSVLVSSSGEKRRRGFYWQ